jgi:Tol biopolymer transport system component
LLALFAALLLLSVGPGATASSSLPPRNGLIALNGTEGIYVIDPSTGTRRVVPKSAEMSEPTWSPDGTLLAVSSVRDEISDVYTVKPDGTERTLVVENAYSPSWSPDGKQLVVVRESASYDGDELAVVDSDGSNARTLEIGAAPDALWVSDAEWSPDGKLIAFVTVHENGATIGFVSPDGKPVSIPEVEFDAGSPETGLSWSPDSTRLSFDRWVETKNGGHYAAVVRDLATGHEAVYDGEQHGAQSPAWSPEGDQLAYLSVSERPASTTTTTHSCGGDSSVSHLWVMSPDGTKAHKLAEGEYYGTPSWGRASDAAPAPAPVADEQPAPAPSVEREPAPAADEVPAIPSTATPPVQSEPAPAQEAPAKSSDVPSAKGLIAVRGSNAIYLVDPGSAAAHKVPETADMISPAWSPNGSLLAVERVGTDGSSSVYTIRPDGTQPQLVAKNASAPSWSTAGDTIFVVRNECSTPCEPEDDEANVRYSVRPDGSDLQRVDLEQADVNDPRELAWRGDGSPLSFFDEGSANAPGTFDTTAAAWSPDETRIAFIGALGPADDDEATARTITAGLWVVSADGGTPQLLLEGASGWPSWPSDSR